jgi:hypothetical protein
VSAELLPEIEELLSLYEDELEEEDKCNWESDDAPFKRERLPGLDHTGEPIFDSDFLEAGEDFPDVLIKAHNAVIAGKPQSLHWHVPVECGEMVVEAPKVWGYEVEQVDVLEFF